MKKRQNHCQNPVRITKLCKMKKQRTTRNHGQSLKEEKKLIHSNKLMHLNNIQKAPMYFGAQLAKKEQVTALFINKISMRSLIISTLGETQLLQLLF
jgi:hypothetical protein